MQLLRTSCLLILCSVLFSCDPCKGLDCVSSDIFKTFRVWSSTSNNDLLYGPSAQYNRSKLRFFSVKGADTTFYLHSDEKIGPGILDSAVSVRFLPLPSVAYISFGNGDIDTLELALQTRQTKCCGAITSVEKVRYNGVDEMSGQARPIVLYK
jgi:hypothetical protein